MRQAWPWGTVEQSGLAFLAFSTSLTEINDALDRMYGKKDGIVDALLSVTTSTNNNYYYCPTVKQIAEILE